MCTAMMSVAMFGLPSPRSLEFSSRPAPECETNPAGKYDGPVDYPSSAVEESGIETEKTATTAITQLSRWHDQRLWSFFCSELIS